VFKLPPLPYSYNALEPYIDARTLEIHHDRHHRAYVDNLNKAITNTEWEGKTLEELFVHASRLPIAIRNNAGGDWNHSFYWLSMTEHKKQQQMPERLKKEFVKSFGSVEAFKEALRNASLSRFGSGNAWLIRTKDGALQICSTPNQDNPLMDDSPTPPELACF
jgi:Fe-Mn family superoxide dismutase